MDQLKKTPMPDIVEFLKGCPLCERSNPELEKAFEQFAQWLYAIMTADHKTREGDNPGGGVDFHP
jgi:hypothetical protein